MPEVSKTELKIPKIRLLRNQVFIQQIMVENVSTGGIILDKGKVIGKQEGIIAALGPDADDTLEIGMTVRFSGAARGAEIIELDKIVYMIMIDKDVLYINDEEELRFPVK